MLVVQVDGQNVEPVSVDEFRIGLAETYDVIVTPEEEAYTAVCPIHGSHRLCARHPGDARWHGGRYTGAG